MTHEHDRCAETGLVNAPVHTTRSRGCARPEESAMAGATPVATTPASSLVHNLATTLKSSECGRAAIPSGEPPKHTQPCTFFRSIAEPHNNGIRSGTGTTGTSADVRAGRQQPHVPLSLPLPLPERTTTASRPPEPGLGRRPQALARQAAATSGRAWPSPSPHGEAHRRRRPYEAPWRQSSSKLPDCHTVRGFCGSSVAASTPLLPLLSIK